MYNVDIRRGVSTLRTIIIINNPQEAIMNINRIPTPALIVEADIFYKNLVYIIFSERNLFYEKVSITNY